MNDETKTDAPEPMSCEWWARDDDALVEAYEGCVSGLPSDAEAMRKAEEHRDRAAKLRRLAVLEEENAELREDIEVHEACAAVEAQPRESLALWGGPPKKEVAELEKAAPEGRGKCPRCIAQGQPASFASPVECGFPEGIFDSDNWMCATLGRLRGVLPEHLTLYNEDSYAAIVACPGEDEGFLVVSWYKNRGRTSEVRWMCEEDSRPATLEEVEATIERLERGEDARGNLGGL